MPLLKNFAQLKNKQTINIKTSTKFIKTKIMPNFLKMKIKAKNRKKINKERKEKS